MSNTGNRNTGGYNTGDCDTGDRNTGNWNTGDRNTGNRNTGDRNTGNRNTGDRNTGNRNTGDWNTGDCNTGKWNTGNWNSVNCETGHFNTEPAHTIRVFNQTITMEEWREAYLPVFLYFDLTEWIQSKDMTDEEKEAYPTYTATGGHLREYTYKEAFQKSWEDADPEDRERIRDVPGFDPEVFYEISGIDLRGAGQTKELTVEEVSKLLGYDVKIIK